MIKEYKTIIDTKDLTFEDISDEESRQYSYENFSSITIHYPLRISQKENAHTIVDSKGHIHYIPFGWLKLSIKKKE